MELPDRLIISVSGIRGRVGIDLTPEVVVRVAAAFGGWVRERGWGERVVLARDSRPSGPSFAQAASAGLRAVGCEVHDLGLVPTPTALLEIEEGEHAGGIVITASHNPKEWNALKLASPAGAFLTPEQGAELVERLRAGQRPAYVGWDELGDVTDVTGAVDRHIRRIRDLELVEPDRIAARGFQVALDCTRGAGGVIMPQLLEGLGCTVIGLELETDGRFTREPEPIPSNLGRLAERVRESGADLGMAVDPDVDRLALVDGTGQPIGEDYTLALATRLVLDHESGPVVTNLSTSQILDEVCERAGVLLHRSAVGEANVAALMRQVDAVIGGEGNGGVILPALHHTRDAPLAAALVLQLLVESGSRLQDLVAQYPQFRAVKERVPRPDLEPERLYEQIEESFVGAEVDHTDGVRLRWPERKIWLHVRPSGTEPILRLIAEGPADREPEIRKLVGTVRQLLG